MSHPWPNLDSLEPCDLVWAGATAKGAEFVYNVANLGGIKVVVNEGALEALISQLRRVIVDKVKLSEADTRAHFIDPILGSLGYDELGDVVREHPLKSSGQFLDYLIFINKTPFIIVEAKGIHNNLSERDASQLVSYCAIEGVRWGVLTNGTTWQLYDRTVPGGVLDQHISTFELVTMSGESDPNEVKRMLSLFSKKNLSSSDALERWSGMGRASRIIQHELSDPDSRTINTLRSIITKAGLKLSKEEVAGLCRQPVPAIPSGKPSNIGRARGSITKEWADLLVSGRLPLPAELTATFKGQRFVAKVNTNGEIEVNGVRYLSLSAAGDALTRTGTNGWMFWSYEGKPIADLRK